MNFLITDKNLSDFQAKVLEGLFCQTHELRTRDGYKVVLYDLNVPDNRYPIHGRIESLDGDFGPKTWASTGSFFSERTTGDVRDLVLVPIAPATRLVVNYAHDGKIGVVTGETEADLEAQMHRRWWIGAVQEVKESAIAATLAQVEPQTAAQP